MPFFTLKCPDVLRHHCPNRNGIGVRTQPALVSDLLRFLQVPRLMQHLQAIRGDEEYLKYLAKLKRINLLILDDFGVSPLKAAEARDLLEIVEDRTNQSSLIVTSQLAIKEWHGYLHNATIADAILDRIVHNAYKIEIKGGSQRKENAQKAMI